MKFGIERLLEDPALRAPLQGKRVALLAHPASVTADLTHSLDALAACPGIRLAAAFGPQHGLKGDKQDNMMETPDEVDARLGIPELKMFGAYVPVKARIEVPNGDGRLKPEMFARLRLDIGDASPFLTIPKEAVVEIDGKHFVYVVDMPNHYQKREVAVSNVSSDQVRILQGLTARERKVAVGAVLIKGQEGRGRRP